VPARAKASVRALARRAFRSRLLPFGPWLVEWKWSRDARRALEVPRRPATFNEKVRHKMASDHRPLLTTFADKVAVREYVSRTIGPHVLTEHYLVTEDPEAVRPESMPREVALKASHASGGCVLVAEHAAREHGLPDPPTGWQRFLVHPDSLDWDALRARCRTWLASRYGYWEWAYRGVPARIVAEELLLDGGEVARDYKFFVFHGRARLVEVDFGRFGTHVRSLFTPEWELLPVAYKRSRGPETPRPDALAEMIAIAEALAAPVDFVRVDLYCPGSRIVFGELTSYPIAGRGKFTPASFDAELGSWWSQPRRYR